MPESTPKGGPLRRTADGRWIKGTGSSPNPGGRPKSMAYAIREDTADGKVIRDYLLELVEGTAKPKPSHRDRIEALKILLDRGWGKAVETSVQVALDARQGGVSSLTDEQLRSLATILRPSTAQGVLEGVAASEVQVIECDLAPLPQDP